MLSNVASMDRGMRIGLGLVAIVLGLVFESWWGAVGAILMATALVRWCPLYRIFGKSTCPMQR